VKLEQKQADAVLGLMMETVAAGMKNGTKPERAGAELRAKIVVELARLAAAHTPEPNPVERLREGIRDIRIMMNRVGPRDHHIQRRWEESLIRAEAAILWWESGRGAVPGTQGMP